MLNVDEDLCLPSPWKGFCRMEDEDHRMEEDQRMEEVDTSQADSLSPISSLTSSNSEDGSCSSPPPPSATHSGGSSSSSSSGNILLPPCRVCGEKASGFHYGVNTCEACKGFFRRSLQRKDKKYKCAGGGRCEVGPGKRNSCPACRYDKCLAVGMSKGAIKTGRYTHQKRTKDILEVKMLQRQKGQSQPQSMQMDTSPGSSSLSPGSSASPVSSPEVPPDPCSFIMEPEEMDRTIKDIIDSHNALMVSHDFMPQDVLDQKAKDYAEQYILKQQMFGNLDLLPPEEYEEIYRTTGIDIDNRQAMMKFFASNMEIGIRRFINFSKTIPGFTELPIEDQASLVKASRFEYWFFGNFRGFFSTHKVAVMPSGKCLHVDEIKKIWDNDFLETVFTFADTMRNLHLTSEETIILKAVVVMFRDRCDLKAPEQVEAIQWKLIQCLLHLFEKNGRNSNKMFAQITCHLISARDLTEWNFTLARRLHLWQAVRDSPLLLEILSV